MFSGRDGEFGVHGIGLTATKVGGARTPISCRISVLGTVPSQLRGAYPGGPGSKPECLRVILTWGEKLPVKLSAPWRSCCAIFELLIASEYWLALHSDCSTWRDPADGQEKHVYEALPGLDMLVLTDDGRDVARGGAVGEVGVGRVWGGPLWEPAGGLLLAASGAR